MILVSFYPYKVYRVVTNVVAFTVHTSHIHTIGSFDNLVSVWDIRQTLHGKDRNESGLKSVEALALPNTPLCVKVRAFAISFLYLHTNVWYSVICP